MGNTAAVGRAVALSPRPQGHLSLLTTSNNPLSTRSSHGAQRNGGKPCNTKYVRRVARPIPHSASLHAGYALVDQRLEANRKKAAA